ncbi:MAG TPA: hypothetical protein PLK77_06095 [Pyrinomonadaceae bacterium]|nr:hypothetical protein [Pyrinomonadaceae bacterium]
MSQDSSSSSCSVVIALSLKAKATRKPQNKRNKKNKSEYFEGVKWEKGRTTEQERIGRTNLNRSKERSERCEMTRIHHDLLDIPSCSSSSSCSVVSVSLDLKRLNISHNKRQNHRTGRIRRTNLK